MAVIGSIRKRSFLLLVVIGLAMLAFILGDIFSNRGAGPQQLNVGEVDGVEIGAGELDARTSYWSDLYASSYNQPITRDQARNLAWQEILKDKVLMKEIKLSGLDFTVGEFDDVRYGAGVLQEFKNNFRDENGQFSKERVLQTYSQLKDQRPEVWEAERKRLMDNRLSTKYNTLLKKTIFATDLESRDALKSKSMTVDLKYVGKKFAEITDEEVTVGDNDIRSYYGAHKNDKKFEQLAGRDMKLVTFPVTPTSADIEAIREDITSEVSRFENAINDSLYVIVNGDTKAYRPISKSRTDMDSTIVDRVFAAAPGTVFGPIETAGQFKLIKVLGNDTKETASVRHILLKSDATNDAVVKLRADSLERAIKRGADFESLVNDFSEDPGSKAKGGLYEEFPRGQMVPEFENFSFDERPGSVGTVKTTYGYHIIEVISQNNTPQKKYVELKKNIVPSTETYDSVYQLANAFVIDNGNAANFEEGAAAAGYTIGTQFVVALLTGSREDGMPAYEDVMDKMKVEVIKEKKAALISSQFGSFSSLEDAASAAGATVTDASGVSYTSLNISGAGREPEIVGKAFSLEEGDTAGPIVGANGVYVIQVQSKNIPSADGDLSADKMTIATQLRNLVTSQMNNALNEAKGVDNQMSRYY